MGHLRILLADCDAALMSKLCDQWGAELDVEVVSTDTTGQTTLAHCATMQPDVLVMELILKKQDGFFVLDGLQQLPVRPQVIVYAWVLDDELIKRCAALGVKHFVKKPCDERLLLSRIRTMAQREAQARELSALRYDELPEQRERVTSLLTAIGMPKKLNGYRYLRKAILMAVSDQRRLNNMMDLLYDPLAKSEGVSSKSVERSIRYAIEIAFMYGCLDEIQRLFGFTINSAKGKPSNKEFISMMVDRLLIS